ncbi:uncharacterized protein BDR25DRAFT_266414 [Lindgomyces ingoldianus]|uniref:Uncharacterized protein n=1 Tax=Lindgomyces ingoldianus TaxID=673940 RepID=A0ACB6QLQ7_9PLEO|nr:uncharacterized protein BDR25DRAFT_266414 [Lindgomyces ingoldianus]KAF2467944.1 hypothetical protein BDR25DRAFT_266414 [Lindgomyces ingoldianus]
MADPRLTPTPIATTLGVVISYYDSLVTLLLLPGNLGVVFPAAPLSGVKTDGPKTIAPLRTDIWNGENVSIFSNEFYAQIGSATRNILGDNIAQTPVPTTFPLELSTNIPTPSQTALAPSSAQTSLVPTNSAPPTSNSPSRKGTNISSASTAGIAVGCLIAGALLAGLFLWFCMGHYRNHRKARDQEASTVAFLSRENRATVKKKSFESGSPISQTVVESLPQPMEDKAISGEISKISSLVKNHVQSFYHNSRVSPGLLDLDDLQALATNLAMSPGTLSTLLGNSDTREIALRFCIAWVFVSRMQLHSDPNITFLPPDIAKLLKAMPVSKHGPQAHALFLSKWRAMTAKILQPSLTESSFSSSDPRNHNIQAALEVLDRILQPYCDSRVDNNQRRCNLEEILKRAASFAFTLFSQPGSWDFDWQDEESVKSGSLCIFPALVQVENESGELLKPPRQFSEAVVRCLDG